MPTMSQLQEIKPEPQSDTMPNGPNVPSELEPARFVNELLDTPTPLFSYENGDAIEMYIHPHFEEREEIQNLVRKYGGVVTDSLDICQYCIVLPDSDERELRDVRASGTVALSVAWISTTIDDGTLHPWENFIVSLPPGYKMPASLTPSTSSAPPSLLPQMDREPSPPKDLGPPSDETRPIAEQFFLKAAQYHFQIDPDQKWTELYKWCHEKVPSWTAAKWQTLNHKNSPTRRRVEAIYEEILNALPPSPAPSPKPTVRPTARRTFNNSPGGKGAALSEAEQQLMAEHVAAMPADMSVQTVWELFWKKRPTRTRKAWQEHYRRNKMKLDSKVRELKLSQPHLNGHSSPLPSLPVAHSEESGDELSDMEMSDSDEEHPPNAVDENAGEEEEEEPGETNAAPPTISAVGGLGESLSLNEIEAMVKHLAAIRNPSSNHATWIQFENKVASDRTVHSWAQHYRRNKVWFDAQVRSYRKHQKESPGVPAWSVSLTLPVIGIKRQASESSPPIAFKRKKSKLGPPATRRTPSASTSQNGTPIRKTSSPRPFIPTPRQSAMARQVSSPHTSASNPSPAAKRPRLNTTAQRNKPSAMVQERLDILLYLASDGAPNDSIENWRRFAQTNRSHTAEEWRKIYIEGREWFDQTVESIKSEIL